MHRTEQIFDHVFELSLSFDDGAHAFQCFRLDGAFNQSNGMTLCHVIQTHAFGRFGLDAYLVHVDAEQIGDTCAHFACDGANFRGSQDEGCVDVDDAETSVVKFFKREVEKDGGVGIFPAGVAVLLVCANF
jgi:hypothetical protein